MHAGADSLDRCHEVTVNYNGLTNFNMRRLLHLTNCITLKDSYFSGILCASYVLPINSTGNIPKVNATNFGSENCYWKYQIM